MIMFHNIIGVTNYTRHVMRFGSHDRHKLHMKVVELRACLTGNECFQYSLV